MLFRPLNNPHCKFSPCICCHSIIIDVAKNAKCRLRSVVMFRSSSASPASARTSKRKQYVSIIKARHGETFLFNLDLRVKCPLFRSDFNQNRNLSTDSNKTPSRVSPASLYGEVDGKTDRLDDVKSNFIANNSGNDELDTQLLYFICLLQSSTCFEQRHAHHQEVKLY